MALALDAASLPNNHVLHVLYEPRKFKKIYREGFVDTDVPYCILGLEDYTIVETWMDGGQPNYMIAVHLSTAMQNA